MSLTHGDLLLGHARLTEPFDDVALHAHSMGLMKPSGGGGVKDELIFRSCDTNVGSFGIQLPMTMRPPGFVTRTIVRGHVERLGREHGAEDRDGQVEGVDRRSLQVARVAFLKLQAA